jgi:hypothetical protein
MTSGFLAQGSRHFKQVLSKAFINPVRKSLPERMRP